MPRTKRISAQLRKNDLLGRWGREEFTALLSGTDIESAFVAVIQTKDKVDT